MKLFLLSHIYEYGDDNEYEESKFLGVYTLEKKQRMLLIR